MPTTTPSAALVPAAPVFTNTERLALAGFLAGYSGLTREAYEPDLCQPSGLQHDRESGADVGVLCGSVPGTWDKPTARLHAG